MFNILSVLFWLKQHLFCFVAQIQAASCLTLFYMVCIQRILHGCRGKSTLLPNSINRNYEALNSACWLVFIGVYKIKKTFYADDVTTILLLRMTWFFQLCYRVHDLDFCTKACALKLKKMNHITFEFKWLRYKNIYDVMKFLIQAKIRLILVK